jgi:CubicO group peptidase (beta-lactamase class C family)
VTGNWLAEGKGALDRWIEEFVASGASPSAVAALGTVDGSRTVAHGAVVSHQGHQRPTASVSYDIASLTKVVATWPLTGLAVVSGALDLDEPVGTYFDQPSLPGAVITTRHILSHTSGMAVRTRLDQYVGSGMDLAEHLLAENFGIAWAIVSITRWSRSSGERCSTSRSAEVGLTATPPSAHQAKISPLRSLESSTARA